MARLSRKSVKTSDGVRLSLLESGHGPPIVLLPGWSQSAEMFRHQFEGLSASHRLIALDWRGHGESEKVDFGYRLSRFAMDLQEVLYACELDATAVLGHSMGNAVLWCHWEMFGRDRVRQMVIAEQPPSLLSRPEWSPADDGKRLQVLGVEFTCDCFGKGNGVCGEGGGGSRRTRGLADDGKRL